LEGGLSCKAPLSLRGSFSPLLPVVPVLSWFQGGCKREWLRAKDNRYKMETEMPSFSLI
jgi:hypothetical protein